MHKRADFPDGGTCMEPLNNRVLLILVLFVLLLIVVSFV